MAKNDCILLFGYQYDQAARGKNRIKAGRGSGLRFKSEKPYSAADLDWHDPNSRTSIEQHQHASRVAIKDDLPAINDYDTVLIGFPIWWGIPPRLIADLIDRLPLNGKQLAGFATSGSSGFERAQSYLERTVKENNADVQVLPGRGFKQ